MNPSLITKCDSCGMPAAEGPLHKSLGGKLRCDNCLKADNRVCDFCTEPDVMWLYRAHPFSVMIGNEQGGAVIDMDTEWRACTACRVLIDASDERGMALRATTLRGLPDDIPLNEIEGFIEVIMTYYRVVFLVLSRPPEEVK